jgi:hypothetical protein
MTMSEEIPLAGGFTQKVVRVGNTVRRQPRANAAFVRDLLGKLQAAGFDGAPRWLGVDEKGRDIFSFVEGGVPLELGHFDDAVFTAAARFIRRYHDATAAFFANGAVACHNDLSPCNFAFRDGVPAAVIDFDLAAEGARIYDLGYAAWTWLDFGNEDDYTPAEQIRRLKVFARAYDPGIEPGALLEAILLRQTHLIDDVFGGRDEGAKAWATWCRDFTLKLRGRV